MASLSYHVEVSQTPGRFKCWTLHQWQEHPSQCDSGQGQASKVSVFSSSWRAGCSLNFSTSLRKCIDQELCLWQMWPNLRSSVPTSSYLLLQYLGKIGRHQTFDKSLTNRKKPPQEVLRDIGLEKAVQSAGVANWWKIPNLPQISLERLSYAFRLRWSHK